MPSRRRSWVAVGLLLSAHPRLKGRFHPEKVLADGLIEQGVPPDLGEEFLRPEEGRAIFTGTFPDWADKEILASEKAGVAIVTYENPAYPPRLRNLPDPPPFLYVRGELPVGDAGVAVVGSRRATPYGIKVAGDLGRGLARAGLVVVSGLARGIDTAAHRGALAGDGRTVGVLGSGIDIVYPKENRRLFDQVAGQGALVSEFPLGTPPHAHHFPVRNRVIAALSEAVVVVEAARDSGSLITARLAADELGLPVAAVPGPVTSRTSVGCNDLLYDGATPVRDVLDAIDLLPPGHREAARSAWQRGEVRPASGGGRHGLPRETERVLLALSLETARSLDELASSVRLAPGALLGHLLELEIRGLAARLPGGLFVRKQ